jgi:hypothetical protein
MNNKIYFLFIFLILIILFSCVTTPSTYILFYNNTEINILKRKYNINNNYEEYILNKYDFFFIISPGNALLPEYGKDNIYSRLLSNGYNEKNLLIKIIVNNNEYILTPEIMAYVLSNVTIYDKTRRRHYIKITELLDLLNIDTNDINNIIFILYNPIKNE